MVADPQSLVPSAPPPTRTFSYGTASVGDLRLTRSERTTTGRLVVKALELDGLEVAPTPRFWRSLFARFGLNDTVFRYFEPDEVFERVWDRLSDREEGAKFRYCVEHGAADARLLGVTSPNREALPYDDVVALVERLGAADVSYRDGLLTTTHQPRARHGVAPREIGADAFQDRFVLETPVDGYGHPRLFLSLIRMVCTNGLIGYTRAFRSDIPSGKDLDHCIARAIASFDAPDGYSALRQRFDSAQRSYASVREALQLITLMERLETAPPGAPKGLRGEGLTQRLRVLAGNLTDLYGLANLDALSEKRRRVLPARCRVYDLLNFASEVATHHAEPAAAWQLQGYIGRLIADEYDLEGTADGAAEFDAFFLPAAA